ncbi:MAG TPA: right-handed parallel beta-helix repeat-containing protein, partial [Acidobacteriota bacterium]|nr:right-handed parallel beta-helix repeat-containing protein [Acidobacteriota bacterium]
LPPMFVGIPQSIHGMYGETVTLDVTAVDPEGATLVLEALDMPPGAIFDDHGDGTGRFELLITDLNLGIALIGFVASDGELADTAYVWLEIFVPGELPDDLRDSEFRFDIVETYSSAGQIDQMRLEDVDCDGLDEVLFRETIAGQVPVLRIWSPAQGRFLDLPPAPEIRGYSLRPGQGELEPVLWTDYNAVQVLNSSKTGWETVAVLPYDAEHFHWLPGNPSGARIAYLRANHTHTHSESPFYDCEYINDRYWSDVVLMAGDSSAIWDSLGHAEFDRNQGALDPWGWRQIYSGTSLEHLLIPSSWRDDDEKGGMECLPMWALKWFTDLFVLDRDSDSPQHVERIWYFSNYDATGWALPSFEENLIGLDQLRSAAGTVRLACVGRTSRYDPWRMTVLSNPNEWTSSEVTFDFNWVFRRGGVVTFDSSSAEVMLLSGEGSDAFIFSVPDAEALAHLNLPRSGRFLTGYVANDGYRDLVFNSGSTVEIFRLTTDTLVLVPQTLHVPTEYPSIQAGIDAASNGDIVLVAPGTYDEVIDFSGKAVKVIGAGGPAVTTLQPSFIGTAVWLTTFEGTGTEFSGFTVIGGQRNHVIEIANGAAPVIRNNIFEGYTVGQQVISVSAAYPLIERNLFIGNTGFACIGVYAGGAEIVNNTMVGNVCGLFNYGVTSTIKNNIIVGCSEYGIHAPVGVVDYNNIWGNVISYTSGTIRGYHDISQDPGFRDTAADDYDLTMESFCVDNGDPVPTYVDADGTRNDMGAYPIGSEFQPRAAERSVVGDEPRWVLDHTPTFGWRFLGTGAQAAYEVEVGSDNDWSVAEMWATGIITGADTTVVYSGLPLADGGDYVYRVRVHDGATWGGWSHGFFHMNAIPSTPVLFFPVEDGVVNGSAVVLSVVNATDPEDDSRTYDFEVYRDEALSNLEAAESGIVEQEQHTEVALGQVLTPGFYWWRVRAHDGRESSSWSAAATFIVRGDQVIYVPADQPTIQLGIKAAGDGDTVLVEAGTYHENIDLLGKRVVVRSADGPDVTILSAADTMLPVVSLVSGEPKGAAISGFTITGGRQQSGILCIGSSPTITENIIAGNRSDSRFSTSGGGIALGGTTVSMISRNVMHHNEARYYGGAIHVSGGRNDTIWGNVMYANTGTGDVRCLSSDVVIINNTISVTTWGGIMHQHGSPYYGSAEIRNNIVFFAPEVAIYSANDCMVADYNCTFANKRDYQGVAPGASSIFGDALFVDSAAGDYRLLEDSPCIDAGDPDPAFNDPDGSRSDIGAIPYTGTLAGDVNGDGVVDVLDVVEAVDARYRTAKAGLNTADSLGSSQPTPSARTIQTLIERLYEIRPPAPAKPR